MAAQIKSGQIWRRKRDGVRVEVTALHGFSYDPFDIEWREADKPEGRPRRTGMIYVTTFRQRYELEVTP